MEYPQRHLQTLRDGREETIFKADSLTIAITTVVSTSIAGSDRSLSNDANIHFGSHHYGKEDNFSRWMLPSIQNQEHAPSPNGWKVP